MIGVLLLPPQHPPHPCRLVEKGCGLNYLKNQVAPGRWSKEAVALTQMLIVLKGKVGRASQNPLGATESTHY